MVDRNLMRVEGSCHCGEISYEATVDPDDVGICHCTDCEMLTGSAYRVTVPAATAHFELKKGQPRRYIEVADSGAERVHAFCPSCGSPIYSSAVDNPGRYSLRVGCLQPQTVSGRAIQWKLYATVCNPRSRVRLNGSPGTCESTRNFGGTNLRESPVRS